jgi:hypothetical protein
MISKGVSPALPPKEGGIIMHQAHTSQFIFPQVLAVFQHRRTMQVGNPVFCLIDFRHLVVT